MTDAPRAPESVQKLLAIAREDAAYLGVDLADIKRARRSVEFSIVALEDTLQREYEISRNASAPPASRQESVRARKVSLQASLLTFAKAEDSVRDKLEAILAEIEKLEDLVALNQCAVSAARSPKADKAAAPRKAS
jgi:hypothetical protein